MVAAQIALDSGIMCAPTIAAANSLVELLNSQYPASGKSFTDVACWADDIRAKEGYGDWHFIDLPVCRLASGACPEPPLDDNAVWAITASEETLRNSSAALQKARMLRFLIHLVGDVHQPLYAAEYFSSQFPSGDLGGNKWPIVVPPPFPYASTNLHSYWDEGLGRWTQQLQRPLNATGRAWVAALSKEIRGRFPAPSLQPQWKDGNVSSWALESHALAESFAYTAPQAPAQISKAYTAQGQDIVLKQLALAVPARGYAVRENPAPPPPAPPLLGNTAPSLAPPNRPQRVFAWPQRAGGSLPPRAAKKITWLFPRK